MGSSQSFPNGTPCIAIQILEVEAANKGSYLSNLPPELRYELVKYATHSPWTKRSAQFVPISMWNFKSCVVSKSGTICLFNSKEQFDQPLHFYDPTRPDIPHTITLAPYQQKTLSNAVIEAISLSSDKLIVCSSFDLGEGRGQAIGIWDSRTGLFLEPLKMFKAAPNWTVQVESSSNHCLVSYVSLERKRKTFLFDIVTYRRIELPDSDQYISANLHRGVVAINAPQLGGVHVIRLDFGRRFLIDHPNFKMIKTFKWAEDGQFLITVFQKRQQLFFNVSSLNALHVVGKSFLLPISPKCLSLNVLITGPLVIFHYLDDIIPLRGGICTFDFTLGTMKWSANLAVNHLVVHDLALIGVVNGRSLSVWNALTGEEITSYRRGIKQLWGVHRGFAAVSTAAQRTELISVR